jgi:hypothetical protein
MSDEAHSDLRNQENILIIMNLGSRRAPGCAGLGWDEELSNSLHREKAFLCCTRRKREFSSSTGGEEYFFSLSPSRRGMG